MNGETQKAKKTPGLIQLIKVQYMYIKFVGVKKNLSFPPLPNSLAGSRLGCESSISDFDDVIDKSPTMLCVQTLSQALLIPCSHV